MSKVASERRTLTVEEAARELGIGRNQAYEAVHNGQIPAIRIGKRLLVPKVAFERILEHPGQREPTKPKAA